MSFESICIMLFGWGIFLSFFSFYFADHWADHAVHLGQNSFNLMEIGRVELGTLFYLLVSKAFLGGRGQVRSEMTVPAKNNI